jgi:hypothetical protein
MYDVTPNIRISLLEFDDQGDCFRFQRLWARGQEGGVLRWVGIMFLVDRILEFSVEEKDPRCGLDGNVRRQCAISKFWAKSHPTPSWPNLNQPQ